MSWRNSGGAFGASPRCAAVAGRFTIEGVEGVPPAPETASGLPRRPAAIALCSVPRSMGRCRRGDQVIGWALLAMLIAVVGGAAWSLVAVDLNGSITDVVADVDEAAQADRSQPPFPDDNGTGPTRSSVDFSLRYDQPPPAPPTPGEEAGDTIADMLSDEAP